MGAAADEGGWGGCRGPNPQPPSARPMRFAQSRRFFSGWGGVAKIRIVY